MHPSMEFNSIDSIANQVPGYLVIYARTVQIRSDRIHLQLSRKTFQFFSK